MKIPGTTKVQLSLLTILAISSVTSTGLLIFKTVDNISEESISCRKENPKEESEESPQSQTGKSITEVPPNLKMMLNYMERTPLKEKSLVSIKLSEK